MPLISVIVPVYNVEKYLHRCVDSILAQTFADFELILVDDGSPDGCPAICDAYAAKDSRVRVIHQENGGISAARNAGLDISRGEYIGFVDSDDYISENMYQELINTSLKYEADISVVGYHEVLEDGRIASTNVPKATTVLQTYDLVNHFYPQNHNLITSCVWNKLFRRELFNSIRFPVGYIYEDGMIQLRLYEESKVVALSNIVCYNYLIKRMDSIIGSAFSEKKLQYLELTYRNYYFFCERELTEQSEYALSEYCDHYLRIYFTVNKLYPEIKSKMTKYTQVFYRIMPKILGNAKICRLKKMTLFLSALLPEISFRTVRRYFPECIPKELRKI